MDFIIPPEVFASAGAIQSPPTRIRQTAVTVGPGTVPFNAGTLQAATATTATLAVTASAVNGAYVDAGSGGGVLIITGGKGKNQIRKITGYVGASRVATVAAWSVIPDATSTYEVSPATPIVVFDATRRGVVIKNTDALAGAVIGSSTTAWAVPAFLLDHGESITLIGVEAIFGDSLAGVVLSVCEELV